MKSKQKERRRSDTAKVDDDRSLWDQPFKPGDTIGLARDIEEHDAIARRVRLSLPLVKRMNVWVRRKLPRARMHASR